MKEDYVPFDLAKKLKEKGFPQDVTEKSWFVGDGEKRGCKVGDFVHNATECKPHLIAAPTIGYALKWLREEKEIHVGTGVTPRSSWRYVIMFCDERGFEEPTVTEKNFPTYESAALAGISYVLNNLI